jgi:hypothetical protein
MAPRKKGSKGTGKEAHRLSKAKAAERQQRKRASLPKASRGGAGGAGSDTGDAGASPWQHTSRLPGAGRRGDDCKLGWLLQIWPICHRPRCNQYAWPCVRSCAQWYVACWLKEPGPQARSLGAILTLLCARRFPFADWVAKRPKCDQRPRSACGASNPGPMLPI